MAKALIRCNSGSGFVTNKRPPNFRRFSFYMTQALVSEQIELGLTGTMQEWTTAPGRSETPVRPLEPAGAEHFVSIIHNGLEFALLKLGAEAAEVARKILPFGEPEFGQMTRGWPVDSGDTTMRDEAARWTAVSGRQWGAPAPTLEAAAGIRVLSAEEKRNEFATTPFRHPAGHFGDAPESILRELRGAVDAALLITCAQALAILTTGARQYRFLIDPAEVLTAWKQFHPMRADLLDAIIRVIPSASTLPNVLCDEDLSEQVMAKQEKLRHVLWRALQLKIPAPTLTASLDYLDGCREAWMPVNLIEARPSAVRS